jgi:polyphenol oxidase
VRVKRPEIFLGFQSDGLYIISLFFAVVFERIMTELLQTAPILAALPGIAHGFGTRRGGVSDGVFASLNCGWKSGDATTHVAENRRRIAAALGVAPDALLTCGQIHSPTVVTVTTPWAPEARPDADALVTAVPHIALGILTADCVPLLLADPVARVIGAAHAGWRGALGGVVGNTVAAMQTLGAAPERIIAALGPCIWQESYEVGAEFSAPFLAQDAGAARWFRPAPNEGKLLFDLPGFVLQRLAAAGVTQVAPALANTYSDPATYYSFRRNTHQGIVGLGSLLAGIVLQTALEAPDFYAPPA